MAADHGAKRPGGEARDRAKRRHRNAERAESDGRRVEDQGEHQSFERRETHQDEKRRRDRDRRAEAGDALEQRAEAKADHDQHDPTIVGKMIENPGAKSVKAFGLDRDIVEQKRIDDDPHDRPEREHSARGDGVQGKGGRKIPYGDRDDEADHQTCK